jgi:hypothetical protein
VTSLCDGHVLSRIKKSRIHAKFSQKQSPCSMWAQLTSTTSKIHQIPSPRCSALSSLSHASSDYFPSTNGL